MAPRPSQVSPARLAAFEVLRKVESGPPYAVELLHRPEVSRLNDADRRLATELAMGCLRWRGELDYQLEHLSGKTLAYFDADVAAILRLGIFQIRFLTRIPKFAAVNEAVELTKALNQRSAAGLVNAVLRKCPPLARSWNPTDAEGLEAACRTLPPWLLDRWVRHFGAGAARALAWASVTVPPVTLRVLDAQALLVDIRQKLAGKGIATLPAHYSPLALSVDAANSTAVAEGIANLAVIQDEASQLVASLLAPRKGDKVLDVCAAPGMKALCLAGSLGDGLQVACDVSVRRLATLQRLLSPRVQADVRLRLVRLDAGQPLPFARTFDRILVDVPCTGTGTLARNPEIKQRLREADVERLRKVQREILRNALAALAPGGRLVYSTCSLEPEENEQVVEGILMESTALRPIGKPELIAEFPALEKFFDQQGYFRSRPDLHLMDGFFAAVLTT
jgi:16S rRNA (cytosine967-C5)-methyltransferase